MTMDEQVWAFLFPIILLKWQQAFHPEENEVTTQPMDKHD
jgi:hypothetical protein